MKEQYQKQLADSRRRLILDAAVAVIAEHGFQRATIKQIARKAGIADGTIYRYFKNKDAILLAIVGRLTEAEVRELNFAESPHQSPADFLPAYVAQRMAEVDEQYPTLKVILTETMVNPALNEKVNAEVYAPMFALAEQYIEQMIESGVMPSADPKVTTRLLAAPIMGMMQLRLLGDAHVAEHWTEYADALSHMILSFFAPTPTTEDPTNGSHHPA